jgi:hypothetical protein
MPNLATPRIKAQPKVELEAPEWLSLSARKAAKPRPNAFVLFGSDFSLNLNLSWRARIVCNFYRHAPHQRLNSAGAGVIFAAIEEGQLYAKFSLARFMTP